MMAVSFMMQFTGRMGFVSLKASFFSNKFILKCDTPQPELY